MKQILIVVIMLIATLYACDKSEIPVGAINSQGELVNPVDLSTIRSVIEKNKEYKRIYDILKDKKFEVGVFSTNNFGNPIEPSAFSISGRLPENVKLILDGEEYKNGTLLKDSDEFKKFFGQKTNFLITDNNRKEKYDMYIPKTIQVRQLSKQGELGIARTGNKISWNVDEDNKVGLVALKYKLYDNEDGFNGKIIDSDYVFIPENKGVYSLDKLLENKDVKSINFSLIRGDIVDFETPEGLVAVSFRSFDHHFYKIEDRY